MSRRRLILGLLFLAVATVVGVLVSGGVREREPDYGGKTLSEWVVSFGEAQARGQRQARAEAMDAIGHIGTNAVPYLLEWMRYEPPGWKTKLHEAMLKLPNGFRARWMTLDSKELRAWGAAWAFGAFGAEAKGAIPELSRRFTHPTGQGTATRAAATALRFLGPAAVPTLLAALTNQHQSVRINAIEFLGSMGTNSLPALPVLVTILQDTNDIIASRVAVTLGHLKLQPELVVPALVKNLQSVF